MSERNADVEGFSVLSKIHVSAGWCHAWKKKKSFISWWASGKLSDRQQANSLLSGMSVLLLFTQHAGLPLQQRQDVLVQEEGAEAEEIPEAQVAHGAPVPHAWLRLDDRCLRHCDLQHLLPWQALAVGHHHSLLTGAEGWQEAPPQRVCGSLSATWHCDYFQRGGAPWGPHRWAIGGRWADEESWKVTPSSNWSSDWSDKSEHSGSCCPLSLRDKKSSSVMKSLIFDWAEM